ncbi:MAG: hypothetical protein ACR2NL_00480, partial [Acidimicrobiia bacterium]
MSTLVFALVASGCAGDGGDTATTVAAAPSTTEAPATTTSTTSTSTTTTSTTTTTLGPEVRPPQPVDVYVWTLDQSATVSAPGQIDESVDSTLEVAVDHDAADMHMTMGILGVSIEVQIVMIGEESWVKEDKKPWRVNDGIWSLDDSGLFGVGDELPAGGGSEGTEGGEGGGDSDGQIEVSYGEERDFYEDLSDLDFEVVELHGMTARKYELPTELHVTALYLSDALDFGDEEYLLETSDIELWLDAATDQLIRLTGEYTGGVELVSANPADYSPEAVAKVSFEVEVTDIDSDEIAIDEPEVPELDVPEGYPPLEEKITGTYLLYPEDWIFVDSSLGGALPGATMPLLMIDLE